MFLWQVLVTPHEEESWANRPSERHIIITVRGFLCSEQQKPQTARFWCFFLCVFFVIFQNSCLFILFLKSICCGDLSRGPDEFSYMWCRLAPHRSSPTRERELLGTEICWRVPWKTPQWPQTFMGRPAKTETKLGLESVLCSWGIHRDWSSVCRQGKISILISYKKVESVAVCVCLLIMIFLKV